MIGSNAVLYLRHEPGYEMEYKTGIEAADWDADRMKLDKFIDILDRAIAAFDRAVYNNNSDDIARVAIDGMNAIRANLP